MCQVLCQALYILSGNPHFTDEETEETQKGELLVQGTTAGN